MPPPPHPPLKFHPPRLHGLVSGITESCLCASSSGPAKLRQIQTVQRSHSLKSCQICREFLRLFVHCQNTHTMVTGYSKKCMAAKVCAHALAQ